jgi:hypothetical protein
MDYEYAQRRRIAVAIAVTVILGPAAFLLNRDTNDDQAGVAIPGTLPGAVSVGGAGDPAVGTGPTATDALGTAPVGYLTGTTVASDNEPVQIAIPKLQEAIKGQATFSSAIAATTQCHANYVKGIPFNATLTVTNLDNSRSVQCVASIAGAEPLVEVVLAVDTFAQIADLTDAPVPVEITWVGP